jgi:thiol-disulfide isomerase/thioredoxin
MKSIFYLFLFLFIASCSSPEKELSAKRIIIAGKVLNPDPMNYKIDFSVNRIGLGQERISPTLDEDGRFKVIFESYVPLDVWLLYKMNFLILTHPGDSTYLEFDGSKDERTEILNTVKYSGDASRINTEAAVFQYMYFSSGIYSDFEKRRKAIESYNEVNYKRFRDSLRIGEQNLFKKFISECNPVNETKCWAKTYLDVEYYRDLVSYPEFHRMANNLKRQDWVIPITYYDFLKDHFLINDSILISSYALSGFVNFYPVYIIERIRDKNNKLFTSTDYFKKHPAEMDSLRFFGTVNLINDPLLRQMVLTEMLCQGLEQSNTRMFKKYEKNISELITEPYLKNPLFDLFKQTTKSLDNPIQASDAILSKLDETSIETDIEKIISNNKGKVIYMDCWATWCGPCIAEMPNSKKLMKTYKPEDVSFIFICLDSEEKNWKATLSKYSLGGQHYFLTKNQSSEFRNAFNIKGIPHYILFDKKGTISENGTLSPSFIKDKLDKLLIEK